MSKNICLIIRSLREGGAERAVLRLAEKFTDLGHQVHIVILDNVVEYDIQDANFKVHCAQRKKHLFRFIRYFKIAQRAKNLKNKITEINIHFDLVVSNMPDLNIIAKRAKLQNIYYCMHNCMQRSYINFFGFKFIRARYENRDKKLYKNQNLITVSNGVKDGVLSLGIQPKTIQTIYNPFYFADIQNQAEKYQIDEKDYIVHIGRFAKEHKRHDILIKAYKKSGIKQKLLLFGNDDNATGKEIRQLVTDLNLTDKVIFKGFNSNPFPYLKNGKCLILSSDNEGLPTVLIEALILGTPVVSTNCHSGPNEILTGKLKEFLSPIGNISALADNIKKMADNPVKITPDYYQRFSADECAKKYLELCN